MKRLRLSVIAIIVILFPVLWINALKHEPVDTGRKLRIMQQPINLLIKNGGVVLKQNEKVRANVATIYASIDARSWTPMTFEKYAKDIRVQGWVLLDETVAFVKYCKDGVLLRFSKIPDQEIDDGIARDVLIAVIQYGRMTIDECRRSSQ